MLTLSQKTNYALLVLTALAETRGDYLSVRSIANVYDLPYRYTAQVIGILARSGLVKSKEGIKGGYCLATPAEKIRVGDVVIIMEGGIAMAPCMAQGSENKCKKMASCPLSKGMPELQKLMLGALDTKTVADLRDQKREQGDIKNLLG